MASSSLPTHPADRLYSSWPGRRDQISQLLRLLGTPGGSAADVFVHGAPKSGKTTVVRACLTQLGRQHAYCEVGDTTKPKQLFSSVLTQLHGVKRRRTGGYSGSTADNAADFVNELAKACPATRPTAFIVLDGAHLLARSPLLTALLTARDLTGANVAWVLISPVPWASQWFCEGVDRSVMAQVYFPAYTDEELTTILSQEVQGLIQARLAQRQDSQLLQLHRELVSPFVTGVVCAHFKAMTRSVPDLRAVAQYLWDLYVEPTVQGRHAAELSQDPPSTVARKLHMLIKERLSLTVDAMQPGMSHPALIDVAAKRLAESSGSKGAGSTLDTQYEQEWGGMPLAAKLLVVAAFIASSNKASQDKAVFDARTKTGRVRGTKKALESDRVTEAAREAKLKGPSPFSLQRLLNIYRCLHKSADHSKSQLAAAQRVQGLHALKTSFVIDHATLTAMDRCDRMCSHGSPPGSGMQRHAPTMHATAGQQPPLQPVDEEGDEEGHVEGSDFQRDLAIAQGRSRRQQGRGRAKIPTRPEIPSQHAGQSKTERADGVSASARASTDAWRLDPETAHLPHPASGASRHGSLPFSCDSASVLQNIATLTSMGLIKRAAAEDMLEAPRMVVGCVDESLAAALARDCGLKLAAYLKYA